VWAVMNAYNKVNGLLVRGEPLSAFGDAAQALGASRAFDSDWGSTYSTAATVAAGMNWRCPAESPCETWFAKPATQKDGNGQAG